MERFCFYRDVWGKDGLSYGTVLTRGLFVIGLITNSPFVRTHPSWCDLTVIVGCEMILHTTSRHSLAYLHSPASWRLNFTTILPLGACSKCSYSMFSCIIFGFWTF